MAQNLKFEFNLKQAGNGLMLTSPDMDDFAIWLEGTENKDGMLKVLSPALNIYLLVNYDLQIERCLVDLQDFQSPITAEQKLNCVVTPM